MGSNSIPGRPMRAHTAIPTLILMLSAAGQPLAAQDAERGSGLWIAGGLGGGWTRVHCDICDDDLLFGLAANLGIGSRLSSSLALGIEGSGWRKEWRPPRQPRRGGSLRSRRLLIGIRPETVRGTSSRGGLASCRTAWMMTPDLMRRTRIR